ncbi:MAG: hypothetical protein WDA07_15230 [Leucobacter sp.]
MTTHNPELVEPIARQLADFDDEFSWHWLEQRERDSYAAKARAVLDAITETHAVVEKVSVEYVESVAGELAEEFRSAYEAIKGGKPK